MKKNITQLVSLKEIFQGIPPPVLSKTEPRRKEGNHPLGVELVGSLISNIINQDGDDKSDGEIIDEIVALLIKYNLYIKPKNLSSNTKRSFDNKVIVNDLNPKENQKMFKPK